MKYYLDKNYGYVYRIDGDSLKELHLCKGYPSRTIDLSSNRLHRKFIFQTSSPLTLDNLLSKIEPYKNISGYNLDYPTIKEVLLSLIV